MSLASVSRHLKAMAEEGVFQRERLPGGGRYRYTLAEPYRLRWPRERERVPQVQNRVSQAGTRDEARPEKHERGAPARARFAEIRNSAGDLPDQSDRWQARVRSWIKSGGKFWLPLWGPSPNEARLSRAASGAASGKLTEKAPPTRPRRHQLNRH